MDPSAVLNVLLAGALAAVATLYKASRDERMRLAERLAESKRAMYELYVDVLRDVAAESKVGRPTNVQHIAKLRNFAFRSMLIASDPVIRAHVRFMNVQRITTATNVGLPAVADVLLALRKDIGFPDTDMTGRDLLGVFVNEIDDDQIGAMFEAWEPAKAAWDRKMGWDRRRRRWRLPL